MSTIKRIGVISLAKFLGILYGGLGLIAGLIVSIISLFGSIFGRTMMQNAYSYSTQRGSQDNIISMLFGFGAIIFLPILYGILGFIGGLIAGFIANLALRITGGIEVKIENK
jgi:hypothetical protein